ncbi:hypothetical protein RJ640_006236 [Escallonia rubra]|uniref:APO domain-containing protein n=1 Tax=Escallonia rubra TaxID=112253 RepID=A0AA88QNK2_9ASTE|nr:hypothetical protein RJ640_006236 [Escallonia rubra]
MAGQTDAITKPSRSDEVLDPDHQLQMPSLSQSQAIILGANDAVEQDKRHACKYVQVRMYHYTSACGVMKLKSCRSQNASIRKGHHEWADTVVEGILVHVETFHLFDHLGIRIPRAVVELRIKAGVDLPEFALPKVNSLMHKKANYKTSSSG